jgi:hypothetical protein
VPLLGLEGEYRKEAEGNDEQGEEQCAGFWTSINRSTPPGGVGLLVPELLTGTPAAPDTDERATCLISITSQYARADRRRLTSARWSVVNKERLGWPTSLALSDSGSRDVSRFAGGIGGEKGA